MTTETGESQQGRRQKWRMHGSGPRPHRDRVVDQTKAAGFAPTELRAARTPIRPLSRSALLTVSTFRQPTPPPAQRVRQLELEQQVTAETAVCRSRTAAKSGGRAPAPAAPACGSQRRTPRTRPWRCTFSPASPSARPARGGAVGFGAPPGGQHRLRPAARATSTTGQRVRRSPLSGTPCAACRGVHEACSAQGVPHLWYVGAPGVQDIDDLRRAAPLSDCCNKRASRCARRFTTTSLQSGGLQQHHGQWGGSQTACAPAACWT